MKFFQKTGVAVTITVLAVVAALVVGFGPSLTGQKPELTVSQEAPAQETTVSETPAVETSGTAGDETISNKYIRDDAGLFTRSGETEIKDYNDKIYSKTGTRIAILTTADTQGMSLESYTNSAFDSMGLSEYDMLFSIDTASQTWM